MVADPERRGFVAEEEADPTPTSGPASSRSADPAAAAKAAEERLKDEAKKVDEGDFLQKQADEAKRAISAAMADAKDALAEGMDPREWTRRFPMVAIGSAV